MTLPEALLLGIVQGLTEFLPISSTAHLRVVPALFGKPDYGAAFTAVIQLGTLVAVLLYFRSDVVRLTAAWLTDVRRLKYGTSPDAVRAWMIAAGTVPVVVAGLLLKKWIEHEFRSLYVVAGAAIGFALLLLLAELVARRRAGTDRIGWGAAMLVGVFQAMALVPGASRSGTTITGGLFAGLDRPTAARFSFLLSLPSVFAAGVFELYKERAELLASRDDAVNLIVATVVSGVVGYASIAFLLGYLKTHTTGLFIAYRIVLGLVILYLLGTGRLSP